MGGGGQKHVPYNPFRARFKERQLAGPFWKHTLQALEVIPTMAPCNARDKLVGNPNLLFSKVCKSRRKGPLGRPYGLQIMAQGALWP